MVTGNYLPGKNGGIENYTHWLTTLLLQNQFQVEIAALNAVERADYFYESVKVNYLNKDIALFEELIKRGNFDICHFQEYSENGGIDIPWFKLAKKYCQKVFFTFHLPYLTCYKGDFRYKGIEDCNQFNDAERCTRCVIADRGGYKKLQSNLYLSFLISSTKITGKKISYTKRLLKNIIN